MKRWTTADLELLPDNCNRYEIIDGELFVTRAPHWQHQRTCGNILQELNTWSRETALGQAAIAPGIIFSDADNVIPDVVWANNERLAILLDDAGHLTAAPELVVEVLSSSVENGEIEKRNLNFTHYAEYRTTGLSIGKSRKLRFIDENEQL